ncbi:MAG TPA: transglycosylase SLT domain-containing protein [Blastocatellia bacterium]|jgi:soluble lytic murein transglycosylase|nr:transglycosylase SLT domain-containing protein [Blastocatellia bacterium]
MFKSILMRTGLVKRQRQPAALALPMILLFLISTMPMTASCQRVAGDSERGLQALRALVSGSNGKPSADELLGIERRYNKTRAASLARFLRGYLSYSAQNYAEAIEALDARAIEAHSSLADYALFYRAESEAGAGQKSQARRDYETLYTRHQDSLKARDARLREAEMAIALGDPDGAIKGLAGMSESGDADAAFISAQAHESKGRNDQAVRLYRRIYYEIPATAASERAEARLTALGLSPKDNPASYEEERARLEALYDSKQYWSVAQGYDQLLVRFPEAERDDRIQLQRGVSLLNSKQPAQAVLPLSRVSSRNSDMHAEALFNQAEALRRSNRAAEGAAVVDRLLGLYAKSRRAEDALYNLALYLEKQDRTTEAVTRYRQLLGSYPESPYAPEASYEIGWRAYLSKNYTEAARVLEKHLANYRYPQSKFVGEAGFWAAKSEERLGNRARALALYDLVVERYRYGYHGYVAKLRADALRRADPSLRPEPLKAGSDLDRIRANVLHVEKIQETAEGSHSGRLAKADDFEALGLGELFLKEINHALAAAPDSPMLNLRLAQYYSRRGENFQATLILRKGYPDIYSYRDQELPREAWDIFFPMVQWETIKQEAKRYGIDPYTAAGLIRQESVFNPTAVSRVGARGLMQLMPSTGQLVAKREGVGSISAADLFNPQMNIKLGMNYLAQMLGQFGRIEYAAAGYNAGPGRAKRWVAERGGLDIEDWIESIPFSETRGYVQGVLRYAANYRRFYKE